MEDQGKRLLLAVAIAFGIMLVWQFVFPPEKKPTKKPGEGADDTAEVAANGTGGDASKPAGNEPAEDKPAPPHAERGDEVTFVFNLDAVRAEFTSWGGALKSYQLKEEKYVSQETGGGPEELVRSRPDEGLPFQIWFEDSSYTIPDDAEWQGERLGDSKVRFTWESDELKVEKTFSLDPSHYLIELQIDVTKKADGAAKQALGVSVYSFQDPEASDSSSFGQNPRLWDAACFTGDSLEQRNVKDLLEEGPREFGSTARWAGFAHSYFLVALAVDPARNPQMTCRGRALDSGRRGAMRVDLVFPVFSYKAGDTTKRSTVVAYLGPKLFDRLENVPAAAGLEGDPQLQEAVDFGWFGVIARPLLWLLKIFYGVVGNWGIAIILLTLVVKLATLYWTHKSMMSMRSMAKLRPQMEKIKEKYKDDKERQNLETMNLFKTHGVNPLSGCLPMLLQMPIWFGLYRMLAAAAELYQSPFIPGWIDDLTGQDSLPGLGIPVLPILLTGMMFVQSKLTPVTQTGMQQKMMQYGMPLMFGGMSFLFPSGLTLYILTNVCLTAVHHLFIHRDGRAEVKLAKQTGAAAAVSDDPPADKAPAAKSASGSGAAQGGEDDAAGEGDARSSSAKGAKRRNRGKKRGGKRKR